MLVSKKSAIFLKIHRMLCQPHNPNAWLERLGSRGVDRLRYFPGLVQARQRHREVGLLLLRRRGFPGPERRCRDPPLFVVRRARSLRRVYGEADARAAALHEEEARGEGGDLRHAKLGSCLLFVSFLKKAKT